MDFSKYKVEQLKIVYNNPNPKGLIIDNLQRVYITDIKFAQEYLATLERQMTQVKEFLVKKNAHLEEDKAYDPAREEYKRNCQKAIEDFYRDAFAELNIPQDHPKRQKMISHAWEKTEGGSNYEEFFEELKEIWDLIK